MEAEHSVVLAPHLWRALEVMATDMAVEPSALANQAVFAWLRINGYVTPGSVGTLARSSVAPQTPSGPAAVLAPAVVPPAPAVVVPEPGPPRSMATPTPSAPPVSAAPPGVPESVDAASHALAGVVARIRDIEDDVARYVRPQTPWARSVPAGAPAATDALAEAQVGDSETERASRPERALLDPAESEEVSFLAEPATAATTSPEVPVLPEAAVEEPPEESTVLLRTSPVVAYLQRDGQPRVRVTGPRFVIGRGPRCDLVIDSPRVSREHAALVRVGRSYVLEDLGSSNGTWFHDERIVRRELESGDVVRLGTEAVSFFLSGEP